MKYNILFFLSFAAFFMSCEKAKLIDYQGGDAVYFYSIDSANYSFANQVGVLSTDTLFIPMRVLGDVKDYDRIIKLKAVTGTSAKENIHFKLIETKVKANSNIVDYPVILFNTDDLKNVTERLVLEVQESADFPQGSGIVNNSRYYKTYKINFNNRLIKPDYWLYIQNYFGAYSDVKYKFMIDVLGISDLKPDYNGGTIAYSEFINYAGLMSKSLQAYVEINGPMLDETGKEISFPL